MKTQRLLMAVMAAALLLGPILVMTSVAMAQERGTKEEAVALADAAVEHVKQVGPEQAFKDFTNDKAKWTKKDLYVFAMDMKGNTLAHGANAKLVGRNMIEMKDANGVAFIAEMTKTAQTKGQGWVDYLWQHPETKKVQGKSTLVRKLANENWIGVGIYR
jgi:signal transduction histidine kinase